eukprot:scaffold6589_cov123-Cylindrotheca_fusiformis.AAC.3
MEIFRQFVFNISTCGRLRKWACTVVVSFTSFKATDLCWRTIVLLWTEFASMETSSQAVELSFLFPRKSFRKNSNFVMYYNAVESVIGVTSQTRTVLFLRSATQGVTFYPVKLEIATHKGTPHNLNQSHRTRQDIKNTPTHLPLLKQ